MATPDNAINDEIKIEIKNKIEFYLGDDNLKHDISLREKILSNQDGYINIDVLLNYNDIKSKNWTKEDLKKGIELSQFIELDSTGDKVRRKNNLKLPELTLLSQKRKEEDIKIESELEKGDKNNILVIKIICKEQFSIPLNNILEEFKKINPDLDVKYEQFKDNIVYLGILLKNHQNFDNINLVNKFKIEQNEFNVEKCEGEELSKFWKEHGTSFDNGIKEKEKKEEEKHNEQPKKKKEIILGGKKFCNIGLVKMEVNSILSKSKPDEKLQGKAKDFVLDLCSYHKNYHEKIKDPDYVMVSAKEKNKYLKCFYVVDKNQNKVHFSSRQCIDNFIANLNRD